MSALMMQAAWDDPLQAGIHFKQTLAPWCKSMWAAGHRLVVEVRLHEDVKTDRQRRYYHGVILKEIAQKARPNGVAFSLATWKEHFRAQYLGFKTVTTKNPITGKKVRRRRRVSTEDLGVKAYSVLIDKVTAYAVTDLDIEFSCPSFAQYEGSQIDPETGEITMGMA